MGELPGKGLLGGIWKGHTSVLLTRRAASSVPEGGHVIIAGVANQIANQLPTTRRATSGWPLGIR